MITVTSSSVCSPAWPTHRHGSARWGTPGPFRSLFTDPAVGLRGGRYGFAVHVGQDLLRLRLHVRRPVSRLPYAWDAAMYARADKRSTLARRDSALVIEGFPRSGNTFSVAAFQIANGPQPHLGRHLHGAPHLLRAKRLGIPAVALVRAPEDAVPSYLVRRAGLHAEDAWWSTSTSTGPPGRPGTRSWSACSTTSPATSGR